METQHLRFEIVKKGWFKQKYYFRIVASNGRVLCCSEKYHNCSDAETAIETIRTKAKSAIVKYIGF